MSAPDCRGCEFLGRTHAEGSGWIECFCKHRRAKRAFWASRPEFGTPECAIADVRLPAVRPAPGVRPEWCPICSPEPADSDGR